LPVYVEVNMGGNRCGVEPGEPALQLATLIADAPHLAFAGLQAYHGSASICAAGASAARRSPRPSTEPGAPATCWQSRHRMPDYHRAGTGSFEFETVSGVYTELQCGSYIFMDADYGRNRDRDGEPTRVFEPSLFVWATVMSRPAEDRAIVDAGLKALAFDSAPPLVCDEPAATYERASDEHGRLAVSAATNRLGLGDKVRLIPGHSARPSTSTTGMSACAAAASNNSGRSPLEGRFIDLEVESATHRNRRRHSSGTPALRSPTTYVVSNKARVFGDSDRHNPPAFSFAMLEKDPSPRSFRASTSSAAA